MSVSCLIFVQRTPSWLQLTAIRKWMWTIAAFITLVLAIAEFNASFFKCEYSFLILFHVKKLEFEAESEIRILSSSILHCLFVLSILSVYSIISINLGGICVKKIYLSLLQSTFLTRWCHCNLLRALYITHFKDDNHSFGKKICRHWTGK